MMMLLMCQCQRINPPSATNRKQKRKTMKQTSDNWKSKNTHLQFIFHLKDFQFIRFFLLQVKWNISRFVINLELDDYLFGQPPTLSYEYELNCAITINFDWYIKNVFIIRWVPVSGRGRDGPESAGTQVAIRQWMSSIKPYLRAQLTNPAQAKLQIMSLALAHGLTAALC